jgi:hypothetical protein
MWRWRNEHVLAWAICVAVLACPRALWDRLRLRLPAAAEPGAGGAAPADVGEVAALRANLAAVRAELMRTEAERAELARKLSQTTAIDEAGVAVRADARLPVRVFGAQAAAGGASAKAGRVRLDAGTREGVRLPAPLLDGAALAGRLVAVSEHASEAELITATTFRARCRNLRTGAEGILRGAGAGELRFRPDAAGSGGAAAAGAAGAGGAGPGEADLAPGDAIVSSAFSNFAPGGLAAGTVVSLDRDPETGLVEARVRPAADLAGLERGLLVLTKEAPQ